MRSGVKLSQSVKIWGAMFLLVLVNYILSSSKSAQLLTMKFWSMSCLPLLTSSIELQISFSNRTKIPGRIYGVLGGGRQEIIKTTIKVTFASLTAHQSHRLIVSMPRQIDVAFRPIRTMLKFKTVQ